MKYYNFKKTYEEVPDADFYIIIGQRSNGKSTSVSSFLMEQNDESGTMFAYFTRLANISIARDMEEGNGYFTGYLEKVGLERYHKRFSVRDNVIYFGENPLCKQFALSLSGKYKSKQYDENYRFAVYEEFVSEDGIYIRNEWNRFNSVISTISRNRGLQVILIGNTISRFNPYFEHFGIDVMQLGIKAGERRTINTPEGAKVVIEMCDNVYQNTSEIASVLKVSDNAIATTTDWMQSDMVLESDIISDLLNQYNAEPLCIIALQEGDDCRFYNMYVLTDKTTSRMVCNILTDIITDDERIEMLDLMDLVFYIDVKTIECIKAGVKSYVDFQNYAKQNGISILFNNITFFSDDKIRYQFRQKLKFNEPSERIGDTY